MGAPSATILVIEDDSQIRKFLKASLEASGYVFLETHTGKDGLAEAATRTPDLIILDLGLPDMDGLEVMRRLREWSVVPVIVLSARGQENDKVVALDAGANDYLTKPFGIAELLARVRAALRQKVSIGRSEPEAVFKTGDLQVDLAGHVVSLGGSEVHLTPIEFKLLAMLVKNAGKVVTQRQLLKEVWGPNYVEHFEYLRVHMHSLRHKIETEPARPRYLVTETGVGYRLKAE